MQLSTSLIGKIEKAKRYAEQPERVTFSDFSADFQGENSRYRVSYEAGKWNCTCSFFSQWGICSHTMALQRIFARMLPEEAISLPAA